MPLPDFFIVGAMRAGTTTLHHLLAAHPGVFIPEREVFFFDGDDFEEHAEQTRTPDGRWLSRDFQAELPQARPRYEALFQAARPGQILGEDSTTYLTASAAPARIASLCPHARILITLRDPVDRAWSHYWHLVNSGRAVLPFEEALLSQRGTLLKRRTYAPGLRRYLRHFPRERVKVVILEEFIHDLQGTLDDICLFLGLQEGVDLQALPAAVHHRHRARSPRSVRLQLAANWVRRLPPRRRRLPGPVDMAAHRRQTPVWSRLLERLAGHDRRDGYPPMRADTRHFLEDLLGRANAGLPASLGRSLDGLWSGVLY